MNEPAQHVKLNAEQTEALISRVHASGLGISDCVLLEQIIRGYFWVMLALQEAKLSVKRLQRLIFGAPGQPADELNPEGSATSGEAGGEGEGPSTPVPPSCDGTSLVNETPEQDSPSGDGQPGAKPKGGHRRGTGRLGAQAYWGAERMECRHDELEVGQRCPLCGQGNLYDLPPGVEIRVDGNALLSAVRYELQKLRCSGCGVIFRASLPPKVGQDKYSARARAAMVVSRYFLGVPLYRLQSYQAMLGVPVPDSTQWDEIEKVGDCAYVVFEYLESLAAQGELINQDDTTVRILSLIKENQELRAQAKAQGLSRSKARTGMFTTALVVKVKEQTIDLYYSGRAHAGENLGALLEQRQADQDKPTVMSDALSRNEVDETTVIRCHCLAHGRRQFSDLEEAFPAQCRVVLDTLKQVFDHDEEAREQQMSPKERLAYHQTSSKPLMDELKVWLDKQIDDELVETNSSLGKAIISMRRHWEKLTRFLEVEGAPLDNNVVERALKLFIRQRKNSLFYRNDHGAYIASVLTSLIATCIKAGVNVLDYLVALQEHRAEVFADPSAWLPWTYQANVAPP